MRRTVTLERRSHVTMSEAEFESVLSKPLETAARLLAKDDKARNWLDKTEEADETARRKIPFKKVWSDMFPRREMPTSLAFARTAVCLEWFRRRYLKNRALEGRMAGNSVTIVLHDRSGCFTRESVHSSGGRSASMSLIRQEALLVQGELSTPEISELVGRMVLNMLHDALLNDPESVFDEPVMEPVPLKVERDSVSMSEGLADTIFRLLALNAAEKKV